MKTIAKLTFVLITFFFFHSVYAVQPVTTNSPVGYWKTIDDVTGKPKSILKIWQTSNGVLYGQVVKIFPRPGYDENEVCTACKGARHNQRIVGMVILQGLKQNSKNPSEWDGGEVLDPLNGKTYRCLIQVIANGQKLNVRGYIGISLFGRTQTWLRVAGPQG